MILQPDGATGNTGNTGHTEVRSEDSTVTFLNPCFSVIDIKLEKQPEMTVTESSCSC